jgi:hypothetical protein
LEQVHVRGIFCRNSRLELVAGLGIALMMPALAMAAESARGLATQTALSAETRDQDGRTQATVQVTVTGEDGLPAQGAVAVSDQGRQLAGAALNAEGQASIVLDLPAGDHLLRAVYTGDATHQASASQLSGVHAMSSTGIPDFQVSASPATLTLTAGQSGTVTASVTPVNAASLTAPMFVTLSCSGLPDQSSCTFTPENVEILPGATAAITSSMVIVTQMASTASAAHARGNSVAWALLLPGLFGLGGLAWGSRRRRWLNRLSLVALVGLVTMLGTTACNPRYSYEHHGPPVNPATPAGTYTVSVIGQSSNGVTATTHSTTIALTVQ